MNGSINTLEYGMKKTIPKNSDLESNECALIESDSTLTHFNVTQRKLKNRHVQLISISGVVGTALFVAIGKALYRGGPASLLLGFIVWSIPILCITVSTAEMVCYLPVNSPCITMASRCINDSFTMTAAWNFWFLECVQIPFEIVSVNTMLHYWRDDYSAAITLTIQVVLYMLINIFTVRYYGEIEFWLASFKIVLAVGLFAFTFLTMVGCNPMHSAYGFRNFKETPFKQYFPNGSTTQSSSAGYLQGFLACIIQASFTVAGPDYVSMIAGETILPRKVLPVAFKQVFLRLTFLFIGGCFCVGIVCSPNDPNLTAAIDSARPGAGSSPYVIAMNNLGIKILPDIVNAALVSSAFSAGNAYTYCSSRTLYGLAVEGHAPKIFKRCTTRGVPIYAVATSMFWALLSLLQLNQNSAVVLNWLISLITASQLINFLFLCLIYLYFRRAYLIQMPSLPALPFKSRGQPYTTYVAMISVFVLIFLQGYTVFYKSLWTVKDFLFSYFMIFMDIGIFLGYYYIWKGGKDPVPDPECVDLLSGLDEIVAHELQMGVKFNTAN
ncbi:HBL102Cp [Eremothecium sinecaudum]|uniref:HBL102Cp n=1 Tax=Eremothecium sinecaudum TaxID=45286 RepID=A0A109UWH3_9SACH|nr:HBL102Cp [Eremothecium sinecaudum]AMD18800.1 HBL102Cp [Eremothecium sinecaudum]